MQIIWYNCDHTKDFEKYTLSLKPYCVFSGCTQSQGANIHMAFQFEMKHLNKIIQHKYGFIFNYYVSMCAPYYQHEMEENISPYLFWYFLGFIINF